MGEQLAIGRARSITEDCEKYSVTGAAIGFDDIALVRRVAQAYRHASTRFSGHGTSFWAKFESGAPEFNDAIARGDMLTLARLLRNPAETNLLVGYDDLTLGRIPVIENNPDHLIPYGQMIHERLQSVAEAMGAIRLHSPEAKQEFSLLPVEDLLTAIDHVADYRVDFPNPFAHEFGLTTSRGIAGYRAVQAVYQSWKIKQLSDSVGGAKILEIGGGLGRNVYYAKKQGLSDYTIVDIPTTQLAQGYYIGRVVGPLAVSLEGECDRGIRLRSPDWLSETNETFDVVVNVDSITEMDQQHALIYADFARKRAKAFLSINHEANPFTVSKIGAEIGMKAATRSIYWPRPGYLEELFLMEPHRTRSEISGLSDTVSALESAISLAATREAALIGTVEAMKASRSWRVTAPLRAITNRLKIASRLRADSALGANPGSSP